MHHLVVENQQPSQYLETTSHHNDSQPTLTYIKLTPSNNYIKWHVQSYEGLTSIYHLFFEVNVYKQKKNLFHKLVIS